MGIILAIIAATVLVSSIMYSPYVGLVALMVCEYTRLSTLIPELGAIHFTGIIAGATIAAFLKGMFSQKRIRIPSYAQNRAQLIYFLVMGMNVVFAYIKSYAFTTLLSNARMITLYFIVIGLIDDREKFRKFLICFLLVNGFICVFGLYNFFVLGKYIDELSTGGFISDGNDFAAVMNAAIPFAFFLYQAERSGKGKMFYGLLTVLFVLGVICAFSRGGWVGLIGVFLFLILLSSQRMKTIMVVLGAVVIIMLAVPQGFKDEFNTISAESGTGLMRVQLWEAGFRMFLDHPVFGVGMSNFSSVHGRFYMQANPYTYRWSTVHDIYVQLFTELGLTGAVAFGFIIWYIFKDNWIVRRKLKTAGQTKSFPYAISQGLMVGLLGYLISGIFLSVLYYPPLYIIAALSVALRNTVENT
jgi:probable O-glycosylation ligase (exosortase A-associated)